MKIIRLVQTISDLAGEETISVRYYGK
ncbi:hypothetical protein [Paraliobacillus zengyii]